MMLSAEFVRHDRNFSSDPEARTLATRGFLHSLCRWFRAGIERIIFDPRNAGHPLQEYARIIGDAFDSIEERISRPVPPCKTDSRASHISLRMSAIQWIIGLILAYAAHETRPAEQPDVMHSISAMPVSDAAADDSDLPSPVTDGIENIMRRLRTINQLERFLRKFTRYQSVSSPKEFADTFRRNPEEFLRAGGGPCNNYDEFVSEWAARRGVKTYIVVLQPHDLADAPRHQWHQVSVICCRRNRAYIIFDNGHPHACFGNLADCVADLHPTMKVFRQVAWHRSMPSFIGRLSMHFHEHIPEEDMLEFPGLLPESEARRIAT